MTDLDTDGSSEFTVLTTDHGRRLLDLVAGVDVPGPAEIIRWREFAAPPLVAAALRIVATCRQAAAKFTRADRMWFSSRGLEQATAEAVARHKARRFAVEGGTGSVVDLCSGIGGDSIALAGSAHVVSVDFDPTMTARTRWNAEIYQVKDRIEAITARAEGFSIPLGSWLHVDPDRRTRSARKTNVVAEYAPGLDALLGWVTTTRGGAIKLGPASDFATHFGGDRFEVEVVSLRGECKEATAWFGDRVTPGVRRRASVLPSGATWTDGEDPAEPPARDRWVAAGPVNRWIFDPDPALVRAGLLNGFARAHGWTRIEPGVDLLTGPERSLSPLVTSFEVVDLFPLDIKILRREVARRGLGPLDIKTRGLTTSPETYRARLRPVGPNPATWIFVASQTGPGRAILVRCANRF